MTEGKEEKGPGLEGQKSGEGGIKPADAAVTTDRETLESSGALEGIKALDRETAEVLVSVTRAMYPHDRIPDEHYARVVASLDEKASADEELKGTLELGVLSLSTLTGRWPKDFGSLDEAEQVKALKRVEDGPFFKAVASEVVTGLYSQPDIWGYFGYEGPSNDKGGYIDRGFNDIDWLDDAPDYRGKPVKKTFVDGNDQAATDQIIDKEG